MTESSIKEDLEKDPFTPLRLHLVSGKTLDVVRLGTAWPLTDRLLVIRNPPDTGLGGEGYDVISYQNIERIEQLNIGKRTSAKRK